MNKNDIDIFEKLSGQLISVYEEISLLSKKIQMMQLINLN